jgi:hypothetical protein
VSEAKLVFERIGYEVTKMHIRVGDNKETPCRIVVEKLSAAYGEPDLDKICATCFQKTMLQARSLLKKVFAIEAIIAALRADSASLYTHGNVPHAISRLATATSDLMDEAKERALKEVS